MVNATLQASEWDQFFLYLRKNVMVPARLLKVAFATAGFRDVVGHFKNAEGPDGAWEPRSDKTNLRYEQIRLAQSRGNKARGLLSLKKAGRMGGASAESQYAGGYKTFKPTVGGVPRSAFRASNALLVLTGHLRQSLLPSNVRQLSPTSIMFFSNDPKSGAHDEGDPSRNLPARTFMWLSSRAQERMTEIIIDQLARG